jgi:hypothetical protein
MSWRICTVVEAIKDVRLVIASIFFPLVFLPGGVQADGNKPLEKTMPIQATVNVQWNVESGSTRNEGLMILRMQGVAHLAESVSVMDPAAPPGTIITYSAAGVNVKFTYEERTYQQNPPRGCSALLAEYEGTGSFPLKMVNTAMTSGLNIRKLGSLVPKEMLQFAPPEAREMMIDYYDFFAGSEKQEVNGRKRGWNDCNFQPDTKEISPTQLSIRFRITEDGKMKGSRRWAVDGNSGSPSFHIRVSDLPERIERRPLVPEPDGGGGINYAVSWVFGEVDPYVRIERREGDYWVPLPTGEPVNAIAGERMELRGTVMPEDKDPKKGEWDISGEGGSGNLMYIKKYNASHQQGKVEYLDQAGDQKQPEITFYWVDEGTGKVEYKTTALGKSLEESVEFQVKKPQFAFRSEAAPQNVFGLLEVGAGHPGDECCNPVLTSDEQKELEDFKDRCEQLKNELASLDPNNEWDMQTVKPQILQELIDHGCTPRGIQYEGIKFIAEPQDNTSGEVQFVQLLSRSIVVESEEGSSRNTIGNVLDGCYPYPKNISSYATLDAPGYSERGGTSFEVRNLDFEMFLMFRPDGEGNEWVPLKKVGWSWAGAIRCVDGDCVEEVSEAMIPESDQAPDTSEYPEWDNCSMGE